jgi:hypothetical protein
MTPLDYDKTIAHADMEQNSTDASLIAGQPSTFYLCLILIYNDPSIYVV